MNTVILNKKSEPIAHINNKKYDDLFCKDERKNSGLFYTYNKDLLKSLLTQADLLAGTILEPACGTGEILIAIIEQIVFELKQKKYSAIDILNYLSNNVYGNDIDVYATKIAQEKIRISLFGLLEEAKCQGYDVDSFKINLMNMDFSKLNKNHQKYSLIIGNPPYVTMYGKHSRNMNEKKREYYNTFDFVQDKSKNNKFNLSMFFIENGLKSLKPDGRLLYILDLAFLDNAYTDIRKYVVCNYRINSMIYGIVGFDNVASGQIIINISNSKVDNNIVSCINYSTNKQLFVKQSLWVHDSPKYRFSIPLSEIEQAIKLKIEKGHRLDYYYPNKCLRTCCALTGRTDDFISSKTTGENIFPYIEGSSGISKKFCIPRTNRYIKYDYNLQLAISSEFKEELERKGVKNKKRVTLGDKESYLAPKIFIRQSASEIITTYTEDKFAANNSIYILTNKSTLNIDKMKLKYICGILNSDLISFYCKKTGIIKCGNGKIPQIRISDLKSIPIIFNQKYFNHLVQLVEKMLINQSDATFNEINRIVYKIYNIDSDEIDYIVESKNG